MECPLKKHPNKTVSITIFKRPKLNLLALKVHLPSPFMVSLVNSLTTVGYLLGVFFRLWICFLVRISTSAWSQHWKLELKLL